MGIPAITPMPVTFGRAGKSQGWKRKLVIPLIAIGLPLGGCGVTAINQSLNGNIPADRFESGFLGYTDPVTPEGYTDNPQRSLNEKSEERLREKYGDRAFVGRPVDAARAEFNRTGNLDLLNPFFPYRSALRAAGDTDRLRVHDARIRGVVESGHTQFWFVDQENMVYPMDNSTRYVIAGLIVDLMHNRMDLVQETLEKQSPFRFILFDDLRHRNFFGGTRDIGGYWAPLSGDIEIDQTSFWLHSGLHDNGQDTPVHEFVHAAESRNLVLGIHMADGMLPGLSLSDRQAFVQERRRLYREFHRLNGGLGYESLKSLGKPMKSVPGIRAYAFKARAEFLSATHEIFFDSGATLKEASPVLYDIYSRYYRLDTANGYRDLSPEEIRADSRRPRFA